MEVATALPPGICAGLGIMNSMTFYFQRGRCECHRMCLPKCKQYSRFLRRLLIPPVVFPGLLLLAVIPAALLLLLLRTMLLIFVLVAPFFVGPFQAAQTDLTYHIHKFGFHLFWFLGGYLNSFQLFGYLALVVHLFDLANAFDRERVLLGAVGQRIPHQVFEDVFLY